MIYRTLGSTGEKVSAIGVGGWHLGLKTVDEQLAIRIVRSAIDRGINFLDNCWDYNEGASELRMGKALRDGYRERAFVMTKIDGRSNKEAARQLDESLRRLESTTSIWSSTMKSSGLTIRTASFIRREQTQRWLKHAPPAKFVTSDLPAIKIRAYTCTCSK
jgi:diketogulonate reductase-like aldo/keto reductase